MDIPIKVLKHSYYNIYVEVLNPILKLKKREKELLVEYAKIYHNNIKYGIDKVKEIFADPAVKWDIRKELNMSEPSFNNHIKQLRDKSVIIDGTLNPIVSIGLNKIDSINISYKLLVNNE